MSKKVKPTVFGKKQGFDKSVDSKEFSRAFELFELMGEINLEQISTKQATLI